MKGEFDQGYLLERIRESWDRAMPKTRVLVVEDSLTTRKHLVEVLALIPTSRWSEKPRTESKQSSCAATLRPDVITLDMMLPVMSGVAVTEYIMAYCPTPILVVSSSMNRGELSTRPTKRSLRARSTCLKNRRAMTRMKHGSEGLCPRSRSSLR